MALHIFAHRDGWITDARGDDECKECSRCKTQIYDKTIKIAIQRNSEN